RIEKLARLIVDFGANVQRGQIVDVTAEGGKEERARAIAAAAYDRGATLVDVTYYDPHVKRARGARVDDTSPEYIPPRWGPRRLDDSDPPGAWRDRSATLERVSERLNNRRFDQLHFEGDDTDLTVGLLPTSRWTGGGDVTVDGISFLPNLPTEEVFTAPDPER